ncbi:MAG: adenine phosphoribosyltransferase [Gemmatimonadetes bacterium]|nr:adenine phosphoribosyltransferase [Gemmatimonadota bacterium]
MTSAATAARALIRDVPDFPKRGILFRDITPLLADSAAFRAATEAMADAFRAHHISHVVGIESRGFLLGTPISLALDASFVPMRKPGKLPAAVVKESYALEYGTDALEMHADAVKVGARVLVVDDVLATGGTAAAACRLIERCGATVIGCSFLIELSALGGRAALGGRPSAALITY